MAVNKYIAKDGKTKWYFSVRYTDWKGKKERKKREGFKTQREAKEAEADFLNGISTDIDITFSNLVKVYNDNRKTRIAQTTIATKEHMIRTKILPYFGNLPISQIEAVTVMNWQNELMSHINPKTGEGYSQTYLRQIHNQLSSIFNFAIRYYNLTKNPAQLCGSMGKQNAEKFDFWTYEEFEQFITAAKDDITAYTIFNLLFFSGMREGELLALSLNDCDFEKNTIFISRSFARIKGEEIIKETKTPKSKRTIAMPDRIMGLIKEYSTHIYGYKPTERLFLHNKSTLHRIMQKYCDISGIRKIKVHELRHSHASHLIELGVSPLTLSERLGHEDIKTTLNTYAHLYPHKQSEIVSMLSDFIV